MQAVSLQGDERSDAPERLGRRPALDGLRGIAVLLVIAIHVGLLASGYVGVDMFFALSGFLITALLYEEWETTGSFSLRRFYQRRARRLLPALWTLVLGFALVVVLLHPFGEPWPLRRVVAATLLFVNNWVTALAPRHRAVLGALVPTWTLAEEVQFYLIWPLVLWVLLRRRAAPRVVLVLLALAILSLIALSVVMRHVYPQYNSYTSPLDRGSELLLGSAAAIVWRERLLPSWLRRPLVGWLSAGGLVFVIVRGDTPHRWWYLPVALLAATLIVNLLSYERRWSATSGAARRAPARERLLKRALRARPLPYIGRISYGIDLYHVPIYYLLWVYVPVPGRSRYLYGAMVLMASVAAAAASWKLIESPIRGSGPGALLPKVRWAMRLPWRLAYRGD